MSERDAEVIVVGGGPAGSTLAARLADTGRAVILLDKASFPRHKACSEYINPAAVEILDELGVLADVHAAGAHRMDAMHVHAPNGAVFEANFAESESGRMVLGLSRHRFDHLLLERARSSGVDVRERTHVRDVVCSNTRVVGVEATVDGVKALLRASLVVGADGRSSVVSRSIGLDAALRWPKKSGAIAH